MTGDSTVRVSRRDDAVWVGVHRPDKRNALNIETSEALARAIDQAHAAGPAVLVVHSTTPGMFVAGTDIAELAERRLEQALVPINVRLFEQLASFRWPTIAVIDGPALGGGCELALACDLRVGTPAARFAQPEPALGIIAGAGANYRLSQLVGMGMARRMLYAGDVIDANMALAAGLIDRLAAADELDATVDALVAAIARRSWSALELTKLALRQGRPDTTTFDLVAQGLLYESDDKARRMQEFLESRSRGACRPPAPAATLTSGWPCSTTGRVRPVTSSTGRPSSPTCRSASSPITWPTRAS
jgi:enoyl-CoA hydratase